MTTKTTTTILAALLVIAGCGNPPSGAPAGVAPVTTAAVGSSVPVASLLEARDGAACALVGTGTVLVAGGRTANAGATDTAELVDASGATGPVLAHMTTARAGAAAVRLDPTHVLIVGGHDAKGRALATTEIYDDALGTFVAGPSLAHAHDRSAVAVLDSSILVLGGVNEKSVEAVDAVKLTVRTLTGALGFPHADAQAVICSGTAVLVGGGRDVDAPEVYDAQAQKVEATGTPGKLRGQTLLSIKGVVLLEGGADAAGALAPSTEELSGKLAAITALGSARVHGTSVPFDGGTLVLGGDDRSAPIDGTDLVLSAKQAVKGPSLVLPRADFSAVALADGRVVVVGGLLPTGFPCADVEMILPPGARAPQPDAGFNAAVTTDLLLVQAIDELNQALALVNQLEDEVSQLEAQLTAAQDQLAQEQVALLTAQVQLQNALAAIAALQGQVSADNAQIAVLSARAQQAQSQASQSSAQIAALNAQIASLNNQLSSTQAQLAQSNSQVTSLQSQNASLRGQVSALQNDLAAAKGTPPPPPPAPAPAPAPAGLTPSTNPQRPVIEAVDPQGGVPGQSLRIYLSMGASTITVTFGGTTTVAPTAHSVTNYMGAITSYVDVIIPKIAAGGYQLQVTGDGLTSAPFSYRVN